MSNTLIFFFLLCDILKTVYCGGSPLNSFDVQINSPRDEFGKGEKLHFKNDEAATEKKNLEKRRLFFPGSDDNTEFQPDGISMNNEYPLRMGNNHSGSEEQTFSGEVQNFGKNNWDNGRNRFSSVEERTNIENSMEYRSRQPGNNLNQIQDWNKSDILKQVQNQWGEEKNFNQLAKPKSDLANIGPYVGRVFNGFKNEFSEGQNSNTFGKKLSITTLQEPEMRHMNKYNSDYEFDERRFGYHSQYNRDYNREYNRNYNRDYSRDYSRDYNRDYDRNYNQQKNSGPEKGVVINFNTDCPVPRQFSNQILHKIILSPKPSLNTRSEVSMYQFPRNDLISPQQLTPSYFF